MKQCFYFLVFLFTLGEVFTDDYDLGCSKDEVVVECKNPCQPTCEQPVPSICNFLVCQKGCACKTGLLINENQCVPPDRCPNGKPNCVENKEWTNCGAGCVKTCQNINPPIYTEGCKPGCICKNGLILDEASGTCVPLDKCPKVPVCNGKNEEYSECTSECPPTCQSRCREPIECRPVCVKGCACKKGYIRDEVSSQCILPDDCPEC